MKKLLARIILLTPIIGGLIPIGMNVVNAQADEFGSFDYVGGVAVTGAPDAGETGVQADDELIDVIKRFINWTLGILSLIVLVLLLWGGFQMITAAGDEGKHKKGWTILKQAAIGLFFIALAWFVVSMIFWVIQRTTDVTV